MSIKPLSHHDPSTKTQLPSLVEYLGYSGLIPFVTLAPATWFTSTNIQAQVAFALLAYGASITSFLGAVHWGLAMRDTDPPPLSSYVWGVVPSLIAWFALLLDPAFGLVILAALLWLCFGVDRAVYMRYQLSHWLPMRLRLTAVASASCLGGAIGMIR